MKTITLTAYEQAVKHLEETGHYACFEYLGSSVGFYSDDTESISWLNERFAGYFSTTESKDATAVVYSSKDAALFEQLYSHIAPEIESEKEYSELALSATRALIFDSELSKKKRTEKICFVLDRAKRSTLVSYTGKAKDRRGLEQRVVRNMIKLQLLEQGWLPLHAATVEKDGVGICIVGGKHAGKTSTVVNLLSSGGIKLVANDKVFVRDTGTSIEGCGFPNKAGIRVGTLLANPRLQLFMERATDTFYAQISKDELLEIAATTSVEDLQNRSEKITLQPLEAVELFGTSIAPRTAMRVFVSVQFDPELENAHLEPKEGAQAVATVMEHFRPLADERQKFLHTFFSFTDETLHTALVTLLTKYVSAIAVQELFQSARTNAQSEALISALAQHIKGKSEAA